MYIYKCVLFDSFFIACFLIYLFVNAFLLISLCTCLYCVKCEPACYIHRQAYAIISTCKFRYAALFWSRDSVPHPCALCTAARESINPFSLWHCAYMFLQRVVLYTITALFVTWRNVSDRHEILRSSLYVMRSHV
jgi:hypothetical protein